MKVNLNGAIMIPKTYRKQFKEGFGFAQIHTIKPETGDLVLKFCNHGISVGENGLLVIPKYVRTMMKIEKGMVIGDVEFKKQSSVLICKVIY